MFALFENNCHNYSVIDSDDDDDVGDADDSHLWKYISFGWVGSRSHLCPMSNNLAPSLLLSFLPSLSLGSYILWIWLQSKKAFLLWNQFYRNLLSTCWIPILFRVPWEIWRYKDFKELVVPIQNCELELDSYLNPRKGIASYFPWKSLLIRWQIIEVWNEQSPAQSKHESPVVTGSKVLSKWDRRLLYFCFGLYLNI